MKNCLLLLGCWLSGTVTCFAFTADSLFAALDAAIRNKQQYVTQKEQRIAALKNNIGRFQPYEYNKALYEEYRKFNLDSAIAYVKNNLALATTTHNQLQADAANMQLATLYSSLGKYRESEHLLTGISKTQLSSTLLPDYYEAWMRFYEHYATNSYTDSYMQQIGLYRDSLLQVLDTTSIDYRLNRAEQSINQGQPLMAEADLLQLLTVVPQNNYAYAMVAYLLGNIYRHRHNRPLEMQYYTLSALSDTRNAVKDQASIMHLALLYYPAGDIDRAYAFTRSAIEDAVFCKVQFRTRQMAEFFTIINAAYLNREARRKKQLQVSLVSISLLSLFLLLAVLYVYKQMKKVSRMKEELFVSSRQLEALNRDITQTNAQLQERNAQLSEANHIKEAYIAQFFDLCSTYITKLENYRKTLNQKATGKKLEELFEMLRSTTLADTEAEELYQHFDTIFLHLYPGFVKEFNALLVAEEQVTLKPGELLNTELRIFALIRLGITDSVKIAAFLRYSLSTIYNYRTRARNKSAVSREAFENRVMRIGIQPG